MPPGPWARSGARQPSAVYVWPRGQSRTSRSRAKTSLRSTGSWVVRAPPGRSRARRLTTSKGRPGKSNRGRLGRPRLGPLLDDDAAYGKGGGVVVKGFGVGVIVGDGKS